MTNIIKNMINEIFLLISDISIRWLGNKRQFFPTLDDVDNKEIKELSTKLKGKIEKDTLTNILEWQDTNIIGWDDRMYMFIILFVILASSFFILPINPFMKNIIILLVVIALLLNFIIMLSYFILLMTYLILLFTWAFSVAPSQAQKVMPIINLIILSIIFGNIIGLVAYLYIKYKSLKNRIPDFKLEDTFKISLPVFKILGYKLAICRDYAKLTASLLFNVYPNSDIFFFTIPQHVATGIKINNRIYVIDQKLPILTWDNWLIKWKQKNAIVYISKLIKVSDDRVDFCFKKYKKLSLQEKFYTRPNTQKIQDEVVKMLKISQTSKKYKADFEITFPEFATYYEDDEIVIYSMARAIKRKLEDELCSNISRVSKIEIVQKEKDIVVSVYLDNVVDQ